MTAETLPSKDPGIIRLSPSKMILWQDCKRHAQAKILKEVTDRGSIYSSVGTAAHTVVERINRGQEVSPDEREDMFRAELIKEVDRAGLDGISFPPSYKESKETLRGYSVPEGWRFLEGEQKRVLDFDGWQFAYLLDALFTNEDGSELYIVDYKTSAQPPHTNLQLVLYAWAEKIRYEQAFPGSVVDPNKMTAYFWMLRKNQMIKVEITDKMVADIDDWMKLSVKVMRATWKAGKDFAATPGHCHFCPMNDCPKRQ